MPAQSQSYPLFSGRVRHALDAKNRTVIPVHWRPKKSAPLWLVTQSDIACLLAMPYEEFKAIPGRVNERKDVDPEVRQHFIDYFFSEAHEVTPDAQGRFVIPEHFCSELKLKGEVVLAGADAKFKIWNPAAFEQFRTDRHPVRRDVGKLVQV